MRPKVGISSMVLKEGKILLGKRKGSHGAATWATPGGHLEHGESVETGAARELLEETGLIAKSFIRGPYTNDLIAEHHYITLYVFITDFEGEPSCLEPHKCEGWEWFDWDQLPSPLLPPLETLIQEHGLEKLKRVFKNSFQH
ncbi:MAG: NUDIX hydrolase [Simkaniaceae bacterium]